MRMACIRTSPVVLAVTLAATSAGAQATPLLFRMSVEAVGQDPEGFRDPEEKDGGARLMADPSISVAPPTVRCPLPTRHGDVIRSAVRFT